jgi:hypothetical protein
MAVRNTEREVRGIEQGKMPSQRGRTAPQQARPTWLMVSQKKKNNDEIIKLDFSLHICTPNNGTRRGTNNRQMSTSSKSQKSDEKTSQIKWTSKWQQGCHPMESSRNLSLQPQQTLHNLKASSTTESGQNHTKSLHTGAILCFCPTTNSS